MTLMPFLLHLEHKLLLAGRGHQENPNSHCDVEALAAAAAPPQPPPPPPAALVQALRRQTSTFTRFRLSWRRCWARLASTSSRCTGGSKRSRSTTRRASTSSTRPGGGAKKSFNRDGAPQAQSPFLQHMTSLSCVCVC